MSRTITFYGPSRRLASTTKFYFIPVILTLSNYASSIETTLLQTSDNPSRAPNLIEATEKLKQWSDWEPCLDIGWCNQGIQRRTRVCTDCGATNLEVKTRACQLDPFNTQTLPENCKNMTDFYLDPDWLNSEDNPHFEHETSMYQSDGPMGLSSSESYQQQQPTNLIESGSEVLYTNALYNNPNSGICKGRPCGTSGICVPDPNTNAGFSCHCKPGYMGLRCGYKFTDRELDVNCKAQSMEIAINENLLRAYGLDPELDFVSLKESSHNGHTQNNGNSICKPKMITYKNQRIFKFFIPTANGVCGNERSNNQQSDTILVKNTIIWERADLENTLSVKIPLANVTCLYDKTTYIGLSAGPILPISRTAVLSWQERVSFQARMTLWNDRSFSTPIRSNMLKTGENVFAKITLADENVQRPFDTSNLVSVVENCFATHKDTPNVPQTLFIANSCVANGMDYFSEVIKSGIDHEIFLRFKVFEWKNRMFFQQNNLQEIYFRCRITICDRTMEDCNRDCGNGQPVMRTVVGGQERKRKRRRKRRELTLKNNNPKAYVTSPSILLETDYQEPDFQSMLQFTPNSNLQENKMVTSSQNLFSNKQTIFIFSAIGIITISLSVAVFILVFRIKSKKKVIQFHHHTMRGGVENRGNECTIDEVPDGLDMEVVN